MALNAQQLPDSPTLFVPPDDEEAPLVTILVPALNEELTVAESVDWCHEGLRAAGVRGEILIVDSSSDDTPRIALEHGARVLRVPERGLGRAYRDAIPFLRGKYVIMGDADCTYDFRCLTPFLDALESGVEFVMGSRMKGTIEKGAMPLHHRYFGTPVTMAIFNVLFRSPFSDIHCGMRAFTREALVRMDLRADGWEYASEMVLKALRLDLRTAEVPIHFRKDRNGRISNVKRSGALASWKAGWNTLRVMFVNGADFFLVGPGLVLSMVGAIGVALLATGPRAIGPFTLTLHAEALFLTIAAIGGFSFFMGIVARTIHDPTPATGTRWRRYLPFNTIAALSVVLTLVGLTIDGVFMASWAQHDYSVTPSMRAVSHLAIVGLFLITLGCIVFSCMLVVHAVAQLKTHHEPTPLIEAGQPVSDGARV